MISLDQILLLEQRVESAVAKIAQLQAENDALRSKCSELTNALSSKSEQLSTFESDQNKIESGILKALDRLNSIENSVLKAAGQAVSFSSNNSNTVQQVQNGLSQQQTNQQNVNHAEQIQMQENIAIQKEAVSSQQDFIQPEQNFNTTQEPVQFNTMQPVHQEEKTQRDEPEQNQQNFAEQTPAEDENGQFDIF